MNRSQKSDNGSVILRSMLQRLFASLTKGPALNARPHNSRQRIDLMELRHMQGTDPAGILARLLAQPDKPIDFPAKVPVFQRPEKPESEWSNEQRSHRAAYDRQNRILGKLRDIAEDASDYYNDHGEHALFLGFPLVSIPATEDRLGNLSNRILAPLVLVPVNVRVRRGAGPGISIEAAGSGADFVQPNPALLSWLEQQTGINTENLFADDAGEEPWREISDLIQLLVKGVELPPGTEFTAETILQAVPRTDDLPKIAALLPCAILGLFPLVNPGLLRDTKWMMENEADLANPVRSFLTSEALMDSNEPGVPEARERDLSRPVHQDFSEQFLITHADPCQAEAVAHARKSAALVVHGPPGTGKSQTIANIIGDHLARGEQVLFVCDKRTALDVVKYRLDSMGLGQLCGVVHDPQGDRRNLYLGMRERMENLAQETAIAIPARSLNTVNQRLNELHRELRGYFDQLHLAAPESDSFHQLCGEWLELHFNGAVELPEIAGLTVSLLDVHRTDAEEVIGRAASARWAESPYRERIGMPLSQWLASRPEEMRLALERACDAAVAVDQHSGNELPPLDTKIPVTDQAEARRRLANQLEAVIRRGATDLAAPVASDSNWPRWRTELEQLAAETAKLDRPLNRELFLQVQDRMPALGDCGRYLLALDQWAPLATSWKRFFAFKAKKAATEALEPLALPLAPDAVERARVFYSGLKARYLVADLRGRLLGTESSSLASDELLIALREGLPELFAVLEAVSEPVNESIRAKTISVLANIGEQGAEFVDALRRSAQRADCIYKLEQLLAETMLFLPKALADMSAGWRNNAAATPLCQSFVEFAGTLDHAIRLTDRLKGLPEPLQRALGEAALRSLDWQATEIALRASALAREIRRQLRENESLSRIDTQRVEAAFSELQQRTAEKTSLVRRHIQHLWQQRCRKRLLAAAGTRLNGQGVALRQRLFVRGQKAMTLRQMIAAGAGFEGGDPLFDLCPVWMASPATVAQIFPREPLFDVVVFDEASQCRLEEALPVLLRGKRVVIAGDPRQLPPTRFFEQSFAESDDVSVETAEDVFQQQQSEVEDLLSAALNLNVQEAFLDVHYRSRNEALIGFSNNAFYGGRLQPIPGHPRNKDFQAPIRLVRVGGLYKERGNEAEAAAAADLVAELLDDRNPPSIGIACFNLNQRDLILDALDEKAARDPKFADRLEIARKRRGKDSFEGLFVKNLENVQGDERDHIIISTTFGRDEEGRFRRNFGALSRIGGERRLNVLVTRARKMIHVLTSIPRSEYLAEEPQADGQRLTGRHYLYAYLRYAERLNNLVEQWQQEIEGARRDSAARHETFKTAYPSPVAEALGRELFETHEIGSTVYWGNDGFCVDIALTNPDLPADVTIGVITDFTRYLKTPDPIAWEQFRSAILSTQGWDLHRVWSPALFRDPNGNIQTILALHQSRFQKT